jgi:predicted ester cyclase
MRARPRPATLASMTTTTASDTFRSELAGPKALSLRSVELMSTGGLADMEPITHPDFYNREAIDEPPACRGRGPAALYATALWLRSAYSELRWEVHDVVADGDLVVIHATMSGRQTGDFVLYDADGRVREAFPPTGRRFAVTQTHWFRVAEGKVIEHWANRDDMGMAQQLGWVPPSPRFIVRMALAKRRATKR